MKNLKIGSLIFVIVTLLVLMVSTSALADTWQNENKLHNGTGQVANDLEKWIDGDVRVSGWLSALFHSFSYTYLPGENVTKLRWYNGTVNPCQSTNACFRTDKNTITHRYLPRWSYDGVPGMIAGAALSHSFQQVRPDLVSMTIANTPEDGGPVTVGIIQIGPTNTVMPIEALNWEGLNNIPWNVTMMDIHQEMGGSLTLPAIVMPPPAVGVVYRARIWLDSDPANIVEYAGQYVPAPVQILPGTWQNEYLHNGTGQDANDLEKWIVGDVRVSNWLSWLFKSFSYTYDATQNVTKLRWSNGIVKHCQKTTACFRTDKFKVTHKYLPRWSYNAVAGPIAGGALSHDFMLIGPGAVNMIISNNPIDGGPVTIGTIQVAPTDYAFTLETLTWDNMNSIPWSVTLNDIHLNMEGSMALPVINMPPTAVGIVYRATIWLDSDPSNIVEYTGQFVPTEIMSTN